MDIEEAIEQLTFECGSADCDDPRWKAGFLQQLHPFQGLPHLAWARITECITALQPHITTSPSIDRRVVNSLWAIVHWTRAWHLDPESGYFQSAPLTDSDRVLLTSWVNGLSHTLSMWLDGNEA